MLKGLNPSVIAGRIKFFKEITSSPVQSSISNKLPEGFKPVYCDKMKPNNQAIIKPVK
jgi:hypothetical protein